MENNEYQTTSYVEYEKSPQETEKKNETTASSIEEQYFDLPFKDRMKIHKNRIKLKMKTKSKELKEKAKIKSDELLVKSQEISDKIRAKIEEHKTHEKQRREQVVPKVNKTINPPQSEVPKYCSECGVQVTPSGRFCPGCGALH